MELHQPFYMRHDYLHCWKRACKRKLNLGHNEIIKLREDRGNGISSIFRKILKKKKGKELSNKHESAFHILQ